MRSRFIMWLLLPIYGLALVAPTHALQTGSEPRGGTGSGDEPTINEPSHDYNWHLTVKGHLKNGLRYAILPRQSSEPGVGLLMRIQGGFIAERRPGERGLAHLIEHVPFDRANSLPLANFHQTGRLTLGAPSAGTTNWNETNYFFSSRTTNLTDLDTLLTTTRRVASDMTFPVDGVGRQRIDVMQEMARRLPGNISYASYIAAVAPGSPNDLIDAQNSDDVPTAGINTIRSLYHRLYRPERAMIVIVGNVDPAKMRKIIRRRFFDWRGVGPALRPLPAPTFQPSRIAPISYAAFAQGWMGVMISVTMPLPASAITRSQHIRAMLMDLLAARAVENRFNLGNPDSHFGTVKVAIENSDGYRLIRLTDQVAPGNWSSHLAELKGVSCDLTEHGLSEAEWNGAKQAVLHDLEKRSSDMTTVRNVELAKDLAHAVASGQEPIAPNDLLAYARIWSPSIDPGTANDWWQRQWRAGVQQVRVESPELGQISDPPTAIRAALGSARTCAARHPA